MDLGATVCKRSSPECLCCPLKSECKAYNSNQTQNYPSKKPKRLMPTKKVCMYIVKNELGEILLEQRPPEGIWGALYSFPEKLPTSRDNENPVSSKNHCSQLAIPSENYLFHFHYKLKSKNTFSKHRVWYLEKSPYTGFGSTRQEIVG